MPLGKLMTSTYGISYVLEPWFCIWWIFMFLLFNSFKNIVLADNDGGEYDGGSGSGGSL